MWRAALLGHCVLMALRAKEHLLTTTSPCQINKVALHTTNRLQTMPEKCYQVGKQQQRDPPNVTLTLGTQAPVNTGLTQHR